MVWMDLNRRIVLIINAIEKIFGQNKIIDKLRKRLKKIKKKNKKEYYCKAVTVIVYILLKIIIVAVIIVLAVGICMLFLKKNNNSVSELDNNKNEENIATKQDAKEFLQIIEALDEIYSYK